MNRSVASDSIELSTLPSRQDSPGPSGSGKASISSKHDTASSASAYPTPPPTPTLSSDALPRELSQAAESATEVQGDLGEAEGDVAPEGGYGWVVIGACSVSVFFFSGTSYSFGVIQARLAQDGLASPSTLAFIGSLASAALSIFAIPNSNLMRRYGAKKVLLAGGIITGGGEILASFAIKSVGGMFVTAGLIVGLGYSMIYLPCMTLPAQYFVRRRGLANGIVMAFGGLGGGIIALTMDLLLTRVGTAWCFRILGLVTAACVVPAALLVKERPGKKSNTVIAWRLFKDIRFTTIYIASAIATFPLMVPPFFLPLYGASIGLSSLSSAALVSGFNLASALGRAAFGQLADVIGPVNSLILAMIMNVISLLVLWPISTTLPPLVVFTVVSGIAAGAFFSLMPTTIASLTEPAIMASGFGLLITGWGAGYLFGPPIAGYLLQAFGGTQGGLAAFRPAMFYAGSLTTASVLMVIGMKLKTTKSLRKRM